MRKIQSITVGPAGTLFGLADNNNVYVFAPHGSKYGWVPYEKWCKGAATEEDILPLIEPEELLRVELEAAP